MYLIALLVVIAGLIAYFAFRPVNQSGGIIDEQALNIPFSKGASLVITRGETTDTLALIDIEWRMII